MIAHHETTEAVSNLALYLVVLGASGLALVASLLRDTIRNKFKR